MHLKYIHHITLLSICLGSLLFLAGCQSEPGVHPAFYHWRTQLALTPPETNALTDLGAKRLYVKYFDVDRNPITGQHTPLARLQAPAPGLPPDTEIVPCVFLTNRSFQRVFPETTTELADLVYAQIRGLHGQFDGLPLQEIQMDCDWTPATQEPYFYFLRHLRERLRADSIQLSCTVRLHQYKFAEETGVPPVDRGMLMVYNLGNLSAPDETNSIFTLQRVEDYVLPQRTYPLPLDVALPIFGWAVVLRQGRPVHLLNNVRMDTLLHDPRFQKVGPHRVEVQESHYFYGQYLYRGDELRAEAVDPATLLTAARFLHTSLSPTPGRTISLYHLDPRTLNYYAQDTLQAVFDAFD